MLQTIAYNPKQFNLHGLEGISDKTLKMHFKLYEGYVKAVNELNGKIADILKDGKVDKEEFPAYSELTRRLGFEYNGMVLHEYYFENLQKQALASRSGFLTRPRRVLEATTCGRRILPGLGRCGRRLGDLLSGPDNGILSNHWITLHENGNVAGYNPLVVMDVWEHVFILDYAPADRPKYIEAFFSNINWQAVAERLRAELITPGSWRRAVRRKTKNCDEALRFTVQVGHT